MVGLKKFQEGMSSDDIEEKLKYVRQVVDVAKELGRDETINTLIPFLNDWCPENDDEALTELAKEVYNLKEVFSADDMKYVLPILKHLATTEEVVVREAAVDSINRIVEDMSPAVVRDELTSVIDGLFKDEWFTPRVSSASLVAKVYAKISLLSGSEDVSEPLKNLRDGYFNLCRDDTPMVRRAAAKNMSAVFAACADEFVPAFVAQYEDYYNSDDEATKLTLMSFTKELLQRCKDEGDRAKILTIFQNSLEARSYKVREAAALEVGAVATILGDAEFLRLLLEPYVELLKDNNSEVKKNAISQMTPLAKCLAKETFLQKLYQFLPSLATDANHEIAEQVTSVVIDIGPIFPDKVSALFDLLLQAPSPEVRLLLLRRLDEVALTPALVNRVVLEESLDGPDWRVREEVAKHMAYLMTAMKDTPELAKLLDIYLRLFVDAVSRVRETCRLSVPKIIAALGADFAFEKIVAALEKQYEESGSYLLKFNILYTYELVVRALPADARVAPLLATLVTEMNNSVPNIRFISCRILSNLSDVLPADVKTKAIAKMTELQKDVDRDVRFYAASGLKKLAGESA